MASRKRRYGAFRTRISPWAWGQGSTQGETCRLQPRKLVPARARGVMVPGATGLAVTWKSRGRVRWEGAERAGPRAIGENEIEATSGVGGHWRVEGVGRMQAAAPVTRRGVVVDTRAKQNVCLSSTFRVAFLELVR